jgi:hypothetical protein
MRVFIALAAGGGALLLLLPSLLDKDGRLRLEGRFMARNEAPTSPVSLCPGQPPGTKRCDLVR